MKEITQIATIMLGSNTLEFQKLATLLETTPNLFEEHGLVEAYALDDWWSDGDVDQSLFLYAFAEKHGYLLTLDWTGEDEPGELEAFVQKRLIALNASSMTFNFIKTWEETLNWDDLERGDYVIEKLKRVDFELRKNGYVIAIYDLGWDSYSIFIAKEVDFSDIHPIEIAEKFRILGAIDL